MAQDEPQVSIGGPLALGKDKNNSNGRLQLEFHSKDKMFGHREKKL